MSPPRIVTPLAVADILEEALSVVRRHLALMIGIDLSFVPLFVFASLSEQWLRDPANWIGAVVVTGIVSLAVQTIGSAALVHAASAGYLGMPVSFGSAFRRGIARFLPLLLTQILAGVLALVGFLFFVLPGFYLAAAFLLIGPAVVVEGCGPGRALVRSHGLMVGHLLRGVGLLIVSMVVFLAVASAATFLSALMPALATPVEVLSNAVAAGYFTAALVIFYYDLRCRKEAFEGVLPDPVDAVTSRPDPIG